MIIWTRRRRTDEEKLDRFEARSWGLVRLTLWVFFIGAVVDLLLQWT